MELVIDIPEEIYSYVNTQWRDIPKNDSPISIMCNAIIDGTPLPKGYGRLIDAERYRNEMFNSRDFDFFKTLDMQPTIIESDKSESEEP